MLAEVDWFVFGNDIMKGANEIRLETVIFFQNGSSCHSLAKSQKVSVIDVKRGKTVMGKTMYLRNVVFVRTGDTGRGKC